MSDPQSVDQVWQCCLTHKRVDQVWQGKNPVVTEHLGKEDEIFILWFSGQGYAFSQPEQGGKQFLVEWIFLFVWPSFRFVSFGKGIEQVLLLGRT